MVVISFVSLQKMYENLHAENSIIGHSIWTRNAMRSTLVRCKLFEKIFSEKFREFRRYFVTFHFSKVSISLRDETKCFLGEGLAQFESSDNIPIFHFYFRNRVFRINLKNISLSSCDVSTFDGNPNNSENR